MFGILIINKSVNSILHVEQTKMLSFLVSRDKPRQKAVFCFKLI